MTSARATSSDALPLSCALYSQHLRVPRKFLPWEQIVPPWGLRNPSLGISSALPRDRKNSYLGKLNFQRWKLYFPTLETIRSSLGTKKFQEGNNFWNSYLSRIQGTTNSLGNLSPPLLPRQRSQVRVEPLIETVAKVNSLYCDEGAGVVKVGSSTALT